MLRYVIQLEVETVHIHIHQPAGQGSHWLHSQPNALPASCNDTTAAIILHLADYVCMHMLAVGKYAVPLVAFGPFTAECLVQHLLQINAAALSMLHHLHLCGSSEFKQKCGSSILLT